MKISVIGTGYVGLVTAGCLAEIGHEVVCADRDISILRVLEAGRLPIYEPGLDRIISRARKQRRLRFAEQFVDAINAGDSIFICLEPSPLPNGDADLSSIDQVARLIAAEARSPKLVIEKSTVPPQTGQELKRALTVYGRKSGSTFRVASNPEFLRDGTAIGDFLHPNRIVVGVEDEIAERQLKEIYRPVLEGKFDCPVHAPVSCPAVRPPIWLVTTISSAGLIKPASNSFLAMKISYANIVADLAEKLGANIDEVTRAMGLDPRIGTSFLRAGLGFGGFGRQKLNELHIFVQLAERSGVDFSLLKEAQRINRRRIDHFLEKIRGALWVIKGKQIAVLGLAFKPNTDDVRFAPAIDLIHRLLNEEARIRAFDPEAMEKARGTLPSIEFASSALEAARDAEALLIATEWEEFRKLDWERIRDVMARPLILDGRNLLSPVEMKSCGFEYHSIGRPD